MAWTVSVVVSGLRRMRVRTARLTGTFGPSAMSCCVSGPWGRGPRGEGVPKMDLVDYLIALDGDNHAAPDKLVLPEQFVAELGKLYTASERKGREHGCPLICDRASRTFGYGEIAEGQPTSMNIPVSTHANNFGNVHAHPSASIGHAGGHSAHSMQDLAKFADTRAKPYFFQFVVSGPQIYAMVQVNGVSVWDDTVRGFLGGRQGDEEGQMFDAVVNYVGGEKKWLELTAKAGGDTDPDARTKLYEEYKPKAKIGPLMQNLSVKHCAEFARRYNFFFYTGQDGTLTRMLSLPV